MLISSDIDFSSDRHSAVALRGQLVVQCSSVLKLSAASTSTRDCIVSPLILCILTIKTQFCLSQYFQSQYLFFTSSRLSKVFQLIVLKNSTTGFVLDDKKPSCFYCQLLATHSSPSASSFKCKTLFLLCRPSQVIHLCSSHSNLQVHPIAGNATATHNNDHQC